MTKKEANAEGCLCVILVTCTGCALFFVCKPIFKMLSTQGVTIFCTIGGIVAFGALIASAAKAIAYKKPKFEDESFGHACKRWLFACIATCALTAVAFFIFMPSKWKGLATDAKKSVTAETQENAQLPADAK